MDHQEKLEKIRGLSEQQLRREVLIPLFIAMGCQHVIEYHGTTERGKDIIFYEINRFDEKIYTAVVVKKERIHGAIGKPGSIADVANNQVHQALNEPYVDVYGIKKLLVDKCMVITSDEIVSSCVEAIFHTLQKQGLDKCLRCYDGNWLVQKIDEHMPTYFDDIDKDEVIQELQAQKVELSEKKEKGIRIIFELGRNHNIPQNYINVSSTALQKAESGVTLASSLGTVASGEYWEPKLKRSDILQAFIDGGVMEKTATCPNCGHVNDIDLNSPYVFCKNCNNLIY